MHYLFAGKKTFDTPSEPNIPMLHMLVKEPPDVMEFDWGRWYQTMFEVIVEINLPKEMEKKDVSVNLNEDWISCVVKKNGYFGDGEEQELLKGMLHGRIILEDSYWYYCEDRHVIRLMLVKSITSAYGHTWNGLFRAPTVEEDRIGLERFHI